MKINFIDIAISVICKENKNSSFLDSNNISWKWVGDNYIGKRSVWTKDWMACWLEETTIDNIKSWWCGKDSDYNEIFTKDFTNNAIAPTSE